MRDMRGKGLMSDVGVDDGEEGGVRRRASEETCDSVVRLSSCTSGGERTADDVHNVVGGDWCGGGGFGVVDGVHDVVVS